VTARVLIGVLVIALVALIVGSVIFAFRGMP
jgi:hypothetical protein